MYKMKNQAGRADRNKTTHNQRRDRHRLRLRAPELLEERVVLALTPDLGIVASSNVSSYTIGQTITYTIQVQNEADAAPVLLDTPITVTDVAALGLSDLSASAPSGWTFSTTSTTSPSIITATYTGAFPIAAGQALPPITVTGVGNGAVLGVVANVDTVNLLGDLNLTNNAATVDVALASSNPLTSLAVAPATGTYGGSTTLTATLTSLTLPVANEPVDFHLGSTDLGIATTDSSGVATLDDVSLGLLDVQDYANDVTASFAGDGLNGASNGEADLTVTPASLTITANPATKTYGQANPSFSSTPTGFVLGQGVGSLGGALTYSTTATASSNVGSYSITPSGYTSTNYTINYVSGSLSVTPASLTITANPASKVYGQANPSFSSTPTGFVLGQGVGSLGGAPTYTTTATAASNVGSYPITPGGYTSTNYAIHFAAGNLSVTPAVVIVTPANLTKAIGAALPALTANYSGFVNNDTVANLTSPVTLSTTATPGSGFGAYPITASGGSSPNYTFQYGQGTLSVTDPVASGFVTTLYEYILGRAPDPNGLALFVTELETGTSKLAVTSTIYNSSEAASYRVTQGTSFDPLGPQEIDLVMALYQEDLGRNPEISGLAAWVAKLQGGEDAAGVAADIETFPEAVNDKANSFMASQAAQVDLVNSLYEYLLGRAPDSEGLSMFTAQLQGGKDAAGVAAEIEGTSEAINYKADSGFVTTLYLYDLGRVPDPNGLEVFINDLETGASKLAVTQAIYGSPEAATFRASFGTPDYPNGPQELDLVIALYQEDLGRNPEISGLAYWFAELQSGQPASTVASQIESFPEAVADKGLAVTPAIQADLVIALYEDILGRAPDAGGLSTWVAKLQGGEDAAAVASDIEASPEAVALQKS